MVDRATLADVFPEIVRFVELHCELYNIEPGMAQPKGLGREWSDLKQRVYGTFAYTRSIKSLLHECHREFSDLRTMVETLDYIRMKLPSLIQRVEAKRAELVPVAKR